MNTRAPKEELNGTQYRFDIRCFEGFFSSVLTYGQGEDPQSPHYFGVGYLGCYFMGLATLVDSFVLASSSWREFNLPQS